MGISAKAVWLVSGQDEAKNGQMQTQANAARGAIYDRKGRLLASTLPIMRLHLDPKMVLNPYEVAAKLAPLLPGKSEQDILKALARKSRYVELDRKITPARHAAIMQLGLPGVNISATLAAQLSPWARSRAPCRSGGSRRARYCWHRKEHASQAG